MSYVLGKYDHTLIMGGSGAGTVSRPVIDATVDQPMFPLLVASAEKKYAAIPAGKKPPGVKKGPAPEPAPPEPLKLPPPEQGTKPASFEFPWPLVAGAVVLWLIFKD